MFITITHKTEYRYSDNVFLEPHTIRVIPRFDKTQSIIDRKLHITPQPTGISEIIDQNGSNVYFAWFSGMTKELRIDSTVIVETKAFNPYDFLIYPIACQKLPMRYSDEELQVLGPFLKPLAKDLTVPDFALGLSKECQYATMPFLTRLMEYIHKEFKYIQRPEGEPYNAEKTMTHKTGCCRDYVIFAIAVCRALNLASRFASGYYYSDNPQENNFLHAWLEVYLPGAGWRGFDPTHGIACYDRHITISTSHEPQLTIPIHGHFRGYANVRMRTENLLSQLQNA